MFYFAHHNAVHSAESNTAYFAIGILAATLAVAMVLRHIRRDV